MAIVVIIEEIMIVIAAQVMEVVEGWKVLEVVRKLFGIRVKSCYHCVVGGTIPYLNALRSWRGQLLFQIIHRIPVSHSYLFVFILLVSMMPAN